MTEITIRQIQAEEFNRVWPIFGEILASGDTYAYPADLSLEQACAMWTSAPARCFMAEIAGEIVGCYRLAPNQPGPGDHIANSSYMVASAARGRGVGEALCVHSLQEARRSGFQAMQFNFVVSTNTAAVRLWRRLGFEVVGTLPKAFRHPRLGLVDSLVMYRLL
ncbi:GNAT family N-acetyltransferase [Pseudoxanthomonas kalamensis DSM 18571]|uniref:GNAT family N-acetyltransferase n=1 Tax=Pseudoxanthomonas kalamensis TaxID=289483 RepID=UPI001391F13B|nr:GNAT family N-acetyltransferase [Pseudoxanthomonas kalamensis]KAF1709284.1 GNAT family N-acetyltransferase [Pseudoxanthomonas kalamensis DSM 18571]